MYLSTYTQIQSRRGTSSLLTFLTVFFRMNRMNDLEINLVFPLIVTANILTLFIIFLKIDKLPPLHLPLTLCVKVVTGSCILYLMHARHLTGCMSGAIGLFRYRFAISLFEKVPVGIIAGTSLNVPYPFLNLST